MEYAVGAKTKILEKEPLDETNCIVLGRRLI